MRAVGDVACLCNNDPASVETVVPGRIVDCVVRAPSSSTAQSGLRMQLAGTLSVSTSLMYVGSSQSNSAFIVVVWPLLSFSTAVSSVTRISSTKMRLLRGANGVLMQSPFSQSSCQNRAGYRRRRWAAEWHRNGRRELDGAVPGRPSRGCALSSITVQSGFRMQLTGTSSVSESVLVFR